MKTNTKGKAVKFNLSDTLELALKQLQAGKRSRQRMNTLVTLSQVQHVRLVKHMLFTTATNGMTTISQFSSELSGMYL